MYDYFISLGWYCGVAASLSKYGLRSFSGPFDWYYSNFKSVIHFLDTDFQDFLNKENLKVVENKITEFQDVKYDMYYNHEIHENFEKEYDAIYNKYMRRIKKYRVIAQKKICYVRAVRNQEELEYICQNSNYINHIIKQRNVESEIIYLIPQFLCVPSKFEDKYFILSIEEYCGNTVPQLRKLFDSNEKFVTYCLENSRCSMREHNMMFTQEESVYKLDN